MEGNLIGAVPECYFGEIAVNNHGDAETSRGKALSIEFPGQQTAVLFPEDVRKCWKVDLRESWRETVGL